MEFIPIVFIISVLITFIVLYIISPEPEVIIKYPKTTDQLSSLYKDDHDICYRYKTKEVECP